MNPRYVRNIPALTEAECRLLQEKRVLIVGCGGLGGHLADQLARLGVGYLRIADGDTLEPTNLNRQILAEVPLLGLSKARAAAAKILRVNPEVQLDVIDTFLTADNAPSLVSGCDVVLDGLDNIPSRRLLAKVAEKAGIPYVYGAVQGWVAQAAVSLPGDGLLDALYPQDSPAMDNSILSFTPALCAAMQAALCTKLLVGRPVESGVLYYCDLLSQEFMTIPLK